MIQISFNSLLGMLKADTIFGTTLYLSMKFYEVSFLHLTFWLLQIYDYLAKYVT